MDAEARGFLKGDKQHDYLMPNEPFCCLQQRYIDCNLLNEAV